MSDRDRPGPGFRRLWGHCDDIERALMLYLSNAAPPVSIDTLSSLASVPAVRVLNVMEKLKKKRIVCEKKEYGKGLYFPVDDGMAGFTQDLVSEKELRRARGEVLDFYARTLAPGPERALTLAELYRKLGDAGQGLRCIKEAADILYHSGQEEKAASYYCYLLEHATESTPDQVDWDFLDGILDKLSLADHILPVDQRLVLLTGALEAARRHEKWDSVVLIGLTLGQTLKAAGEHDKASSCFNESWRIAEERGNHQLLRMAALSLSDLLFSEGKVSEAVRRYEMVVGNLEEFGDDEASLKASAMLGWCYVICGRISRGMGMIEAVRSKARSLSLRGVSLHADLMSALSLIEIRRVTEAGPYVRRVLSAPPETLSHYVLWAAQGLMAYLYCMDEEYEKAHECQKEMQAQALILGGVHQRGSYGLECLNELEKKGFFLEGTDFNGEIKSILTGGDLYMKGVAYRLRALRNIKERKSKGRAFLDLRNSEKYLKKAGADIELARTWIALGDAYLKEGEIRLAQSYLEKAWTLFSKVDKNLFPKDLLVIIMPQEQKIEYMIDRIININESLRSLGDMSSFLERVINVTMDFTMAMRGAFFILEPDGEPKIIASRNLDPLMLRIEQFRLITGVVAHVALEGAELLSPGVKTKDGLTDDSLREAGINSLICMPAKLGEYTHGYLYLDSRLDAKPFPNNHLPFVRLLCNQIAVGLSNISIYKEMSELKDRFEEEAIFYKREMGVAAPIETIIGASKGIKKVIDQVRQVAPTDSSVLVIGETGVGKELVAKAIHNLSTRKDGPFIPVNLAALPQDLVASELFGHERGAFTGANERFKGRFELADGGTIFLDEVGDLPLNVQVKLLRVLQEGIFERLGSARPIQSNFRVIAATNKDLMAEVETGSFRQDLYYRLNVFPIRVPPLREREGDIPLIARHYIDEFSRKMGKKIKRVSGEMLHGLTAYQWPGNVRELRHFIERAVILSDGKEIRFSTLSQTFSNTGAEESQGVVSLAEMERGYIEKILRTVHWKVSGPNGAAGILGLKPTTLLSRMKKLGIRKPNQGMTIAPEG